MRVSTALRVADLLALLHSVTGADDPMTLLPRHGDGAQQRPAKWSRRNPPCAPHADATRRARPHLSRRRMEPGRAARRAGAGHNPR